jgi:hypothetical protein
LVVITAKRAVGESIWLLRAGEPPFGRASGLGRQDQLEPLSAAQESDACRPAPKLGVEQQISLLHHLPPLLLVALGCRTSVQERACH